MSDFQLTIIAACAILFIIILAKAEKDYNEQQRLERIGLYMALAGKCGE